MTNKERILKQYFQERASKAAHARWEHKSFEEKQLHAHKMVTARKKKREENEQKT